MKSGGEIEVMLGVGMEMGERMPLWLVEMGATSALTGAAATAVGAGAGAAAGAVGLRLKVREKALPMVDFFFSSMVFVYVV